MEKIIAGKNAEGVRIDKFLAKEFFLYTRGEIIRAIKAGTVLVNDLQIKPSYSLEINDEISVYLERVREKEVLIGNDKIELDVIFENDEILVINKPAGLQVHPERLDQKNTLVNGLIGKYPDIIDVHDDSLDANLRPGIVHRLDRDTSGVMVITKNIRTFNALKNIFKNREARKEYIAVVTGAVEGNGIIDKPLAKSSDYSKQVIANKRTKTTIRNAVTEYKAIRKEKEYSVLSVLPKTGRTHQIRVHLASIGHPIIGDKIYGTKTDSSVKRQLLHAWKLYFVLNGEDYEFIAPMQSDMIEYAGNIEPVKLSNGHAA